MTQFIAMYNKQANAKVTKREVKVEDANINLIDFSYLF